MSTQFARTMEGTVRRVGSSFPVLFLTGARQVGKTSLLEACGGHERLYVSLDDEAKKMAARRDPALFLQEHKFPLTIDEAQYAPELMGAIKIVVDRNRGRSGLFWLTGSQRFDMIAGIRESLAGRVGILDLLGLSSAEIEGRAVAPFEPTPFKPTDEWVENHRPSASARLLSLALAADAGKTSLELIYERIFRGFFPRLWQEPSLAREDYLSSYVSTYIRRDVRDVLGIKDGVAFSRFLVAVAARTGQILNASSLGRDVGIDHKTVMAWLSVLETMGLVYLLYPYFSSPSKRMMKRPKIYFLDTGLCAYLTRWPSAATLMSGMMAGPILETYVFAEILKSYWHNGREPHFSYYCGYDQRAIDLLIEEGDVLYPVEIKRTTRPVLADLRSFRALESLGRTVGSGALFCFIESPLKLAENAIAIPIEYL